MLQKLSFFNWSFKKVIASAPDSFGKAKLKIVFTILIFSLIKAFIVIPYAIEKVQYMQVMRAGFVCLLFLSLIKILLFRPAAIRIISYLIVGAGLCVLYSNLIFYVQHITVIVIQLVFMVTLTSYYLIGGWRAGCFTALAILPVVIFLAIGRYGSVHLEFGPEELASPAFTTIVFLNFLTFVLIHYLYYRAFYQNLKEKEALNQQLQINIAEVKALADSRSLFLSTMSHELRTPLNGVIGMSHLIRDTALESQKDDLDILDFSANHLLSVINDILDYNKSELNKIDLEALPVNLFDLLLKINDGLEIKAFEKNLEWILDIDDKLKSTMVVTDPTRLTQVLYNLAGNAIKFTADGSVGITADLVDQHEKSVRIKFSVSDTGIGIAEERQAAIFDPFTQASSDTTRHYGGTGLGLAIVKRLLALFDSNIWLESVIGKGSTFSFVIEFALNDGEISPAPIRKILNGQMKGFKILIADDNPVNVLLLERLLMRWGIETSAVVNGQEAVQRVSSETFDLVLMDLHMPVLDGYRATAAIRKVSDPLKAGTPIIALTASVSSDMLGKVIEAGMQDYLPKPFRAEQLQEKLQKILRPVA